MHSEELPVVTIRKDSLLAFLLPIGKFTFSFRCHIWHEESSGERWMLFGFLSTDRMSATAIVPAPSMISTVKGVSDSHSTEESNRMGTSPTFTI